MNKYTEKYREVPTSTSFSLIATVAASDRSAKGKTTERMKVLKLDKSFAAGVNGLTQENAIGDGYGYRVDDARISLGSGDVFKIKAIQLLASFELWYCFRKFYWFMLKTRENVRILF